MKNKYLFLFPYGIGNFYLLLSVIDKVYFNNSKFYFLVEDKGVAFLLQNKYPNISIFYYKKTKFKYINYFFFFFKLLSIKKQNFSHLISFHFNSYTNVKKITKILNIKNTFGFSNDFFFKKSTKYDENKSELNNYNQIINSLFFLKYKEKETVGFFKSFKNTNIIGLHIGSSEILKYKRWPISKYASLINLINKNYSDYLIILFGGKEDILINNKLINSLSSRINILNLTNKTNLIETENWLNLCNYFISSDSGLSQMANYLALRTFTIIGPTSIVKNKSLNKKSIFIQCNSTKKKCKSVDNFMCSYCYNNFYLYSKVPKCLESIEPLSVFNLFSTYAKN